MINVSNPAELTAEQKSEIEQMVKRANGRRRERIAGQKEIDLFLETLRNNYANHEMVRVYSRQGFVANSYNYRADITFLQATKHEDGWYIIASTTDAKRSHGNGALVTIDGRAA